MEGFGKLLSLSFLLALQAGGLAYRYYCTQKTNSLVGKASMVRNYKYSN